MRYERNGISFGKSAIEQNMNSFNRYKNLTLMNLDFFAIRPLVNEPNIEDKIEVQQSAPSGKITLIHRPSEKITMEYVFNTEPLQLVSINNKSRKRIYLYDDYRYSNGYYFAHSLIKKYDGDTIPSFITRIEKFEEIERIEIEKLILPSGYSKFESDKSSVLKTNPIAKNLYLVTDDFAVKNIVPEEQINHIQK